MKTVFFCIITLVLFLVRTNCYSQRLRADTIKQPKSYWAAFNAGGGTLGYESAFTLNAEIKKNYFLAGSVQAETNRIDLELFGPEQGRFVNVYNFNLQFGKVFKQQISFLTVSSGLGLVRYDAFTNTFISSPYQTSYFGGENKVTVADRINRYSLNVPVLLQGYVVIASPIAIGINAYVNLNTVRTTAGISFIIALGRMTARNGETLVSAYPNHNGGFTRQPQ